MIALVEGAKRQRTPNEIALAILLAGLTIIFLMATVTLRPFGHLRGHDRRDGRAGRTPGLPHPDDHRRPPVGHRHRRHGPGRALQRARDERPRRRGVRRRRRHPARQDGHHHLRQPPGRVDHARAGRLRGRGDRGRPGLLDPRRDARGSLGRGARSRAAGASSAGRLASATTRGSPRSARPSPRRSPFRAETRTSGVTDDVGRDRSSRARSTRSTKKLGCAARRGRRRRRPDRRLGRDPARPRERRTCPRRHRAQGHGQGGPRRTVRRVPPDGHQDRDDHRRQPADRGDHRQGGGRRRLHRAGHARGEDRVHPRPAGRGPPRRHDRRRHQRRAGARPVRRRARDEQRDLGGQGRGQHGRPRLRPDQAARGHRDRQAAADHARLDHDVLDRERRGQVLRHRARRCSSRSTRS